ncbi:ABC transporter substrate-binding protein [Actinomadura flavalba]|uniref:ABC transporter substrate-binding protein n=1 Tax=Actinomadura flavalba TaxID=1120938 RepID=UPI000369D2B1|nr:ABC transporter substrate-binding protein [Actinomadura flavalba]
MKKTLAAALLAPSLLAGCTVAGNASGGGDAVTVTVGYQSKTINTVTAGTLLRSLGAFEKRLAALPGKYRVVWQDYDTGAPITAQMLAGKIDIGSMGDYPLLINGSRAQAAGGDAGTRLVSVTGHNPRGALNGVVVAPGSKARTLRDLRGATISASVGSAGHGTLVQALGRHGLDPAEDVKVENQQPPVGASALKSGAAAAFAQFVAWPGLLVQKGEGRLLYDGGALDVPTFHGVVVRNAFTRERPDVLGAFLSAQIDATRALHADPVGSAERVAAATGLPAETVYLYNGAGGIASFDVTVKRPLRDALAHDVPFLKSIGVLTAPLDLAAFVDDGPIRRAYGAGYDAAAASTANPAPITGNDAVCGRRVTDARTAGEVWVRGERTPRPVADPGCLLRTVRAVQSEGKQVRAAYVPDHTTGTRWFADHQLWVRDGARFLPFATEETARRHLNAHPAARLVPYTEAVTRA